MEAPPRSLVIDWLLGQFGAQRNDALKGYRQFVMSGKGLPCPPEETRHLLLLDNDAFVARHRRVKDSEMLREVSKTHRRTQVLTLDEYQLRFIE